MGYLGVWAVVHARLGYDVEPAQFLSTGEYLITRENVGNPFTIGLYSAAAQAQRSSSELRTPPGTTREIRWTKKP